MDGHAKSCCYALLAFVVCGSAFAAETGSISGTVVDSDGKAVWKAVVMAKLRPTSFAGGFEPFEMRTASQRDGTFLLEGLSAGTYKICVENRPARLLNPCNWSDAPILVTVGDGQAVKGRTISMEKGVRLTVRIDDPSRSLTQEEEKSKSGGMLIGVVRRGAPFQGPESVTDDTTGRSLTFLVPPERTVEVSVARGETILTDDKGVAFSGKAFKVQAVANAAGDSTVTLRVGGVEP